MAVDIIDVLAPKNSGAFPVADTNQLRGGLMSVADATARDAIPAGRLRHGMLVFTQDDETFWLLGDDLTTWTEATFGGSSSLMTSNATLAVSGAGNDSDSDRPARILGGDWSAYPFATVQAAVAALGRDTNGFYHRINIAAGTYAVGLTGQGFSGGGVVDIVGDFVNATLTTGVNTGTAGAGTTATALKKPAAAANWTAENLRGKILLITGGGGYYADTFDNLVVYGGPCMRRIKDNTTDTVSFESLSGLDATTTFRIVDVATLLGEAAAAYGPLTYSVGLFGNTARVFVRNLKNNSASVYFGFLAQGNRLLEAHGLHVAPSAYSGVGIYDTDFLSSSCIYAHGGSESFIEIVNGGRMLVGDIVLDNSRLQIDHFRRSVVLASARDCVGTAVRLRHNTFASVDLDANDCTTTPLSLTNIGQFIIGGSGLTGSNAGAAYGVEIFGCGDYELTGASLAGADDLSLNGHDIAWSDLAVRNYIDGRAFAYWSDSKLTLLGQLKIQNNSSQPYDDLQVMSLQINTYKKEYSADRALPTTDTGAGDYSAGAYAEIIPAVAGTQGAATIIGSQQTLVRADGSTLDGHSIRFFTDVEKSGTGFGTHGTIRNGSGYLVRLYPPSGKKIYLGAVDQGTDNYVELGLGLVDWLTDKDGNWWVD